MIHDFLKTDFIDIRRKSETRKYPLKKVRDSNLELSWSQTLVECLHIL